MTPFSDQGVILRWGPTKEADAHGLIITRHHGLIHVFARGAMRSRKRFSGSLDLFHHVKVVIESKTENSPKLLKEASLLNAFWGIRESYDHLWMASTLAKIVVRSLEQDTGTAHEEEYLIVGSVLQWLSRSIDQPPHWLGCVFLIQWFRHYGQMPSLADIASHFDLKGPDLELWKTIYEVPVWILVSREEVVKEIFPNRAVEWFDGLCRLLDVTDLAHVGALHGS